MDDHCVKQSFNWGCERDQTMAAPLRTTWGLGGVLGHDVGTAGKARCGSLLAPLRSGGVAERGLRQYLRSKGMASVIAGFASKVPHFSCVGPGGRNPTLQATLTASSLICVSRKIDAGPNLIDRMTVTSKH